MLFEKSQNGLKFIYIDMLGIAAFAYLSSGLLYGNFILGVVYPEAVWSSIGCIVGWLIFRSRAKNNGITLNCSLSPATQQKLIFASFSGAIVMLLFFAFSGWNYLLSDKVDRSEHIAEYFFIRIPFYVTMLSVFLLHCETSKRFRVWKSILYYMILMVSIIEMNREFILFACLLTIVRFYYLRGTLLIPRGLTGFIAILVAIVFFLVLLKPLLYMIILGQQYDGGFFNFGETVNWYRWLDFSHRNEVDLSVVQKNDGMYTISSFFIPFSNYESASRVWFRDILENDGYGRTFGYSGVLWVSRYFDHFLIALAWVGLFFIYSCRWSKNNVVSLLIAISLCLVSYRFFRSEWPLVLKTILWTYIYPGIICFLICSLGSAKSKT